MYNLLILTADIARETTFELEIISSYDMTLSHISVHRNKSVVLACKELIGVFN